ncbi:HET-domain-containing protein [Aspergillus sclerotioniger CBS 115572]|uniref:HET-domain-containing protein n=1 Tax=Aspergillus sclerotioniger CBS 115572 TaxID=1450535 RepID=A0A317WNN0_9EURO|nr:HET-domain-containing protein [Aspergillus sclerotioniger CBS 115572]PWY85860.1 HET-domain-containing protein [Aspergillus sclerotioniger CBS 115572]
MRMVSFVDAQQAPPYAILSHTWGPEEEEITFGDLVTWTIDNPPPETSPKFTGWAKIHRACNKARIHGCAYIWIDTCCIDKSSSSELQEAINSMFSFYEKSKVCFAYLIDVEGALNNDVHRARWFTRGWTLQELLAPEKLIFFNKYWVDIGSKIDKYSVIENVTGIHRKYLFYGFGAFTKLPPSYERISSASVAQRMSWAAKRRTTRREDMAYCLLGLFDISMPLLYGEGDKAFLRLQEEIMKVTNDTSLLSWGLTGPSGYDEFDISGGDLEITAETSSEQPIMAPILASHPGFFRWCGDIFQCPIRPFKETTFSMAQRGLLLSLPVVLDRCYETIAYGILSCGSAREVPHKTQYIAIPLVSSTACTWAHGSIDDEYWRPLWCKPKLVAPEFVEEATMKDILIRRARRSDESFRNIPFGFYIDSDPAIHVMGTYPPQPINLSFKSLSVRRQPSDESMNHEDSSSHNHEEGQRMMLVNVETKSSLVKLLVVINYQLQPGSFTPLDTIATGWDYSLSCRVFILNRGFSLQTLQDLASDQGFKRYKELICIPDGGHKVYMLPSTYDLYITAHNGSFRRATTIELSFRVAREIVDSDFSKSPCHGSWHFKNGRKVSDRQDGK